ncbi:MAG: MFS transporter [Gemmataceae bacterium]
MASSQPSADIKIPPLGMGLRIQLSSMMFFQFAIWGTWFVLLGNYLAAMGFQGSTIGAVFGTVHLGAIVSSIFVGQIADQYFSSERLMAVLHTIGGALLLWMSTLTDPTLFYWVALGYALVYSPTLALCNSVAFAHLPDAQRDFPSVRVLGTIGWMFVGFITIPLSIAYFGNTGGEISADAAPEYSTLIGGTRFTLPLLQASLISFFLGGFCLFLPHTPPTGKAGDGIPFLRALGLLKEFSFAVFYFVSLAIAVASAFYFSFGGVFLEAGLGTPGAWVSPKLAIGQTCELFLLIALPFFLRRFGMKWVLTIGMLCWGIRYLLFATNGLIPITIMGVPWYPIILLGIALHGICFDFFFAAGFIHVENTAPKDIRASAQSLFNFLTYGVGMFAGMTISGWLNDYYSDTSGTNWPAFWLWPGVTAIAFVLSFAVLFREKSTPAVEDVSGPAAAETVPVPQTQNETGITTEQTQMQSEQEI